MAKLKVLTVLGTRPEIVRLSRVLCALDRHVDHVLVHTGQNYDHTLNEIFFQELDLRRPDHYLETDPSTLGRFLGSMLMEIERVLTRERPDAMLLLGDTNSALAAVMAKRMQIPVFHMEAGNRCFDQNVPEETNRRLVDHVADYNLVYTEHARRNLLSEGIAPQRVILTGSPLREVLDHYAASIARSDVLDRLNLKEGAYFLVSAHRQENVDDDVRLCSLLDALAELGQAHRLPVLISTHPRTRLRVEALGRMSDAGITFHEPFGFFDYVRLQQGAKCVLSDSGTISEEAAMLGLSAVSLRDAIERPESIDSGGIVLTGVEHDAIIEGVSLAVEEHALKLPVHPPTEYCVPNTSSIVLRAILGNARSHHARNAIRPTAF